MMMKDPASEWETRHVVQLEGRLESKYYYDFVVTSSLRSRETTSSYEDHKDISGQKSRSKRGDNPWKEGEVITSQPIFLICNFILVSKTMMMDLDVRGGGSSSGHNGKKATPNYYSISSTNCSQESWLWSGRVCLERCSLKNFDASFQWSSPQSSWRWWTSSMYINLLIKESNHNHSSWETEIKKNETEERPPFHLFLNVCLTSSSLWR